MGNPSSTISSKGQITLPAEVRHNLGVGPGDKVQFVIENGATTVKPLHTDENPFLRYVGAAPAFANFKEVIAWVRDLRDDDYEAEQTKKRVATAAKKPKAA